MIKILFLDSSALLSFFISDKGTPAMRWLISSDNKAHNATRYVINNRVIREFETELKMLVGKQELKKSTADSILSLFNTHYKNRKFKIVGKEASIEETMEGMYNFLGRLAKPMLVTCKAEPAEQNDEYKTINPQHHTAADIELILYGKNQPVDNSTEDAGYYQRFFSNGFFKKARTTLAL